MTAPSSLDSKAKTELTALLNRYAAVALGQIENQISSVDRRAERLTTFLAHAGFSFLESDPLTPVDLCTLHEGHTTISLTHTEPELEQPERTLTLLATRRSAKEPPADTSRLHITIKRDGYAYRHERNSGGWRETTFGTCTSGPTIIRIMSQFLIEHMPQKTGSILSLNIAMQNQLEKLSP